MTRKLFRAGFKAIVFGVLRIWQQAAYQTVLLSFYGYFLAGGILHVWLTPQALAPLILTAFEWLTTLISLTSSWSLYRHFRQRRKAHRCI